MEHHDRDYYPGAWSTGEENTPVSVPPPRQRGRISTGVWLCILCVVAAVSVLLTYTLTFALQRARYSEQLAKQQELIDRLKSESGDDVDPDKLAALSAVFERYGYYAGQVDEETMMTAVLKAYAEATGDNYAEYYTEEEYAAMTAENLGEYVGIGVSIVQTTLSVEGHEYQVFQIIAIYENAPAEDSELRVGDYIYAVSVNGVQKTVNEIGYTAAANAVRGEVGSEVTLSAFRKNGDTYDAMELSIIRGTFEAHSVTYTRSETDPTVGIVRISSFDLTTPSQFKTSVNALLSQGVEHFVFDVRNNPGGDLQSIKAVLTYFLQEGDLILSAIDKNGEAAHSYVAEVIRLGDEYAACNVSAREIGMYADLDMVVLCNENTASAAEVFTATLQDYGLATVVGKVTFGKGIMQSILPLSYFGNYTGYFKLTTYAYVTKRGVTYHEIGIEPNRKVELSDQAKQYNIYLLPEELDDQLQAAIEQVKQ